MGYVPEEEVSYKERAAQQAAAAAKLRGEPEVRYLGAQHTYIHMHIHTCSESTSEMRLFVVVVIVIACPKSGGCVSI